MEVEEEAAALCLLEMKHRKVDTKTAKNLRNIIQKTESHMFFQMFPTSFPLSRPQTIRKKIENNIENEYKIQNGNKVETKNGKGVFEANPEFIQKLKSDRISLNRLPILGQAIDGIALPRLPPIESLEGKISNCSAPFEKQLTMSDLNKGQGRLVFSGGSVKCIMRKFMTEYEYTKVIDTDHEGLKATVYDRMGKAWDMTFVKWGASTHVLTRGWKEFCSQNKLEMNLDWVTVWMFRRKETHRLCFAIVARRFPTENLIGKSQNIGSKYKKQKN